MQEDNTEDIRKRSSRGLLIVVAVLGVLIIACAGVATALAVRRPVQPLPTLAPRASLEPAIPAAPVPDNDSAGQPAEQQPISPTPLPTVSLETPAAPQPGGQSIGDPYIPELGNTGYDVQRYIIQLALDPSQEQIQGTTRIEAIAAFHGLSQLSLDFVGFEVVSVSVDGLVADFERQEKKLVVDLPQLLPAGTPFALLVTYRGQPEVEQSDYLLFVDHLGFHFPDGKSLFTIAEPDGARYWFPANDHPRDKAAYRFEIVVPAGMTAVTNGQLLETREAATPWGQIGQLFVWEHNYPMAPYLALVAVGEYERLEDTAAPAGGPGRIPLQYYVFPDRVEEIEAAAAITGEAMSWLSERLGPYPFETFGFVTARVPGASMETQTMVLLSDGMIGQRTAVHELVHMWFGDWVSLDSWGEMWRNEGFATYFQLLWEHREDPEALELEIEAIRSAVEGNDKSYPLRNPPANFLFEFNIYYQSTLLVHALRQEMGDEAFFNGLRLYFERYGGGTASDAEFQGVMEEALERSLQPFFDEWLSDG